MVKSPFGGGVMPRYFFHLYDESTFLDEEGTELADLESARAKAQCDARNMACAEVLDGHLTLSHRIDVADGRGEVLLTVEFGDTIEVED